MVPPIRTDSARRSVSPASVDERTSTAKHGGGIEEHATVYIQTPEWKRVYGVRFAQIVNGLEPTKRTLFTDEEDYRSWYDSSRDSAAMVLDADTEPEQTISLVTCSYNIWVQNERTVVVTSENGTQNRAEIPETASEPS